MSLRYSYKLIRTNQLIVLLSGRTVRPRPLIDVSVLGPADTRVVNALLDTGADDTVFPDEVAMRAGIDLTNAPTGAGAGIVAGPVPLRYAEVRLRIADGHEQREWTAWVGFTSAKLRQSILGFAGFLQFFTATFRGDLEEVELTTNSLYPGT